jgi:hypothetical protein
MIKEIQRAMYNGLCKICSRYCPLCRVENACRFRRRLRYCTTVKLDEHSKNDLLRMSYPAKCHRVCHQSVDGYYDKMDLPGTSRL